MVCDKDPCLFRNREKTLYVIIYVDDFLVTAESEELIEDIARKLSATLSLKNFGEPKVFISVQIERNRAQKEIKILLNIGFNSIIYSNLIDSYSVSRISTVFEDHTCPRIHSTNGSNAEPISY